MLLHGQIHGGIAQGAGQALMEDIHFDAAGQLVTASFMDYAMPHAHDFCAIEVESNPVPTKTNPLGVKGAGEAGCVGALPAVANAVVDALAEFGVRHIEMPATPERVWRAMQREVIRNPRWPFAVTLRWPPKAAFEGRRPGLSSFEARASRSHLRMTG